MQSQVTTTTESSSVKVKREKRQLQVPCDPSGRSEHSYGMCAMMKQLFVYPQSWISDSPRGG